MVGVIYEISDKFGIKIEAEAKGSHPVIKKGNDVFYCLPCTRYFFKTSIARS